ncbi:hypothetical protein ACO2Q3_11655 [Caulobacter sp. KR2-114]|uniref:hypothetical protein n=1 Tax=Caulobacter sp. KR2-114 TaxID=3400912 RepID=UPI003C10A436
MTDTASLALPDTPAGRRLDWWIGMLNQQGQGAGPGDWDHYAPAFRAQLGPMPDAEAQQAAWRANAARIGRVVAVKVEADGDDEIQVEVSTDKNRRWLLAAAVEADPPHRFSAFRIERRYDFQLGFREATAADAAILADVERRCPIVMGDVAVHFDRGEDYMDATRLMEDCSIGLASVDGEPAAVSCGAQHVVRVGGALKTIVTVSHLRVLPEHQRKGLWGAANKVLDKYRGHIDGTNAYIAVDNLGMQHGFSGTPDKWSQTIDRASLDCRALAGAPLKAIPGRAATPADAPDIVQRLNAFHDAEEMFVPYSVERFAARMARAPDLYGWDRVWLTEAAVVGAWAHGAALRTVTVTAGTTTVSTRGVVLDYAFAPGAEDQFEALLRA